MPEYKEALMAISHLSSATAVAEQTLDDLKGQLHINPVDLPTEFIKPIQEVTSQYIEDSEFLGKINPCSLLKMSHEYVFNHIAYAVSYALNHKNEIEEAPPPEFQSIKKLTHTPKPPYWLLITNDEERVMIHAFQLIRNVAPDSIYYDDVLIIAYTFLSPRLRKLYTESFRDMARATNSESDVSDLFMVEFVESLVKFQLEKFSTGLTDTYLKKVVVHKTNEDLVKCGANPMGACLSRQGKKQFNKLVMTPGWDKLTEQEITTQLSCRPDTARVVRQYAHLCKFHAASEQDGSVSVTQKHGDVVKCVSLDGDESASVIFQLEDQSDYAIDDVDTIESLKQTLTPDQFQVAFGRIQGQTYRQIAQTMGVSERVSKYQKNKIKKILVNTFGYTA
jgi:DNA-binding CsgD family transcriptional regulator